MYRLRPESSAMMVGTRLALAAAALVLFVLSWAGPELLSSFSSTISAPLTSPQLATDIPIPFIGANTINGPQFRLTGADSLTTFDQQGVTLALAEMDIELRFSFVDANPAASLLPAGLNSNQVHLYRGANPAAWQTNVSAAGALVYQELYPGISLQYELSDGQLKGTYTVAPGADPGLIGWRYDGAVTLAINDQDALDVTLPAGPTLNEAAPIAWQIVEGRQVPVTVSYRLTSANQAAFTVGTYNPALPLIIDPTYVYETTYDVASPEHGSDVDVDATGNAYVVAYVWDDGGDIVVLKVDPAGNILFATFLVGTGLDVGSAIAVGHSDDVYIYGRTLSTDFPTLNAIQPNLSGGSDMFLTRLSATSGELLASTYFGGNRAERGNDVVLAENGDVLVAGATDSTDFFTTPNAIQSNLTLTTCFCFDATVTRFAADLQSITYSTYLGADRDDIARGIGLDAAGNIYIAGETQSSGFPTPNGAFTSWSGRRDGFVARIAADGSALDYGTYLGGEEDDWIRALVVDATGNAHVVGHTTSASYPVTPGAAQPNFVGNSTSCGFPVGRCPDAFVTKVAPDGSSLVFSTYAGGAYTDQFLAVDLDEAGAIYAAGNVSDPFPGAPENTTVHVVKLPPDGASFLYVYGRFSGSPGAYGLWVAGEDEFYLTGADNVPSDIYIAHVTDAGEPDPPPPPAETYRVYLPIVVK